MYNLFTPRRTLYQFSFHFFLVNILLTSLISIGYLHTLPNFLALADSILGGIFFWAFFAISFFAQTAILFFLCFLLIICLIAIFPNRFIVSALSILLAAGLILFLAADAIVFHLFHMHYAMVGWEVFKVNVLSQVITISFSEKMALISSALIFLISESFIAWKVWRYVAKHHGRLSHIVAMISILCITLSYSLNFVAREFPEKYSETNSNLIIRITRFVPYYDDIYQLIRFAKTTTRHVETPLGKIDFQLQTDNRPLAYPKHNLQFQKSSQPLNIVVIAIDTWRYDAMNQAASPNIYEFAQKTLQFNNHWSGGNSTKAGLFSFFYGLPANYWDAFLEQKRGPELIHQLNKENYSISIFSSAALNFPAFDKTIFREVKPLLINTAGSSTVARDQKITQEFKNFLTTRNSQQPFFSFIFYDSVHNYCESVTPAEHPFKPWVKNCNRFSLTKNTNPLPYLNRYLNAVHFVDNEVKQVLDTLKAQHLLKNTIVILTSDHGEEINDHHSGYWQHASAYTSYQLHVPLLIYWPNQKPTTYTHYTTHYDFVPTLMTRVLNCKNPLKDYTLGQSLFSIGHRPILISGSYADYAVISKNQVTRIYNGGDYVINDPTGRPLEKRPLQIQPMREAFEYLNEYYKN